MKDTYYYENHLHIQGEGKKDQIELILQSWSGGAEWAKVSPSETGGISMVVIMGNSPIKTV